MVKIPVTGGAGFIGSHVVDLCLDRGFEVVILDDLSTGRASNVNPNARSYKGDRAYANYLAVTVEHQPGIYNIGWGCPTSINEVFAALAKVTAYPHPVNYGPAKVGETRHIYLDAAKAGKELGWRPTLSLDEGLEMTMAYFREKEWAA